MSDVLNDAVHIVEIIQRRCVCFPFLRWHASQVQPFNGLLKQWSLVNVFGMEAGAKSMRLAQHLSNKASASH
jgi:hypothetical protein